MKEDINEDEKCDCKGKKECDCGENCDCKDGCDCGEDCGCHDECSCDENCDQNCDCECHDHERADEYLAMAQRLQADFDNYRKHVADQLENTRREGAKSVIEVFLPCLDTFKEAKKSISDEKVLAGVNMIEEKILNALKTLGVEKIETVGTAFDHNKHEAIAFLKDESKDDDIILDEFQAGYKMDGKVIRYAKVIINKKGE